MVPRLATRCCAAAAALLTAGAIACAPPPATADATAPVRALFAALDSAPIFGAPTDADLQRLAPYLSADLLERLRQARALRDAAATAAPGEKPPFADGSLFTSLFEGATGFTVGRDSLLRDPRGVVPDDYADHLVTVGFTYASPGDTVRWEDRVLVTRSGNRWVVADIRYGGSWDFAAQGSLMGILRTALTPGDASPAPGDSTP
ncbi:MAG: hypothetical protein RLZ32_466 [Gemmatimonadota bacterium]|jgi:hypothetical protein